MNLPEYLLTKGDGSKIYAADKAYRPNSAGFKAVGEDEYSTRFPNSPVDLSKFKVYRFEFANTKRDRHRDEFTMAVLQKFEGQAKKGEVIGLFDHDSAKPIGRVLGAYMDGESLMGYMAVHKAMKLPGQPEVTITEAIDSGILKDVSVGFGGVKYVAAETTEGYTSAWRIEDDTNSPTGAELREVSIVSKGAQIGATLKSADGGNKEKEKTVNMNPYNHTYTFGEKSVTVTGKVDGDSIKVSGIDELVKAANDANTEAANYKAEITALKAAETEARKPFEADILNLQKQAGVLESDQYNDQKLKAMPFDKLVKTAREIVQKADEKTATKTATTPVDEYIYKEKP